VDETVYEAAWLAYKAAPRAVVNGPSRSAVRAAVDAVLAFARPEGTAPAYWLATFRQYKENGSLCQTLVKGGMPPTLDALGIAPRPFELVGTEPLYAASAAHGWVVADGQGARWRKWGDFGPEWTTDRNAALHFARHTDAEAFAKEDEDAWLIQPIVMPTKALDRHHCVPPMWLSEQIGGPFDDLTPGQAWRDGFNECRTRTLLLIQQELTETGSEEETTDAP